MADLDLRVDYKDDILDSSVNTKRKYNIIENEDGTKSLEDVSVYTQNGDSFGAADINKTNQAVLDLNSSLSDLESKYVSVVVTKDVLYNASTKYLRYAPSDLNLDLNTYRIVSCVVKQKYPGDNVIILQHFSSGEINFYTRFSNESAGTNPVTFTFLLEKI